MKFLILVSCILALCSGCVMFPVYVPHKNEVVYVTRKEAKQMADEGSPFIYPKANRGAIFLYYQRGLRL